MKPEDMMAIIRHACTVSDDEMTREELERLLDAELSAPPGMMNEQLVSEILLALEDGVSPQEQQLAWQRLVPLLERRRP